jgi:predicted transposase/invertase (TIGR01784 family)
MDNKSKELDFLSKNRLIFLLQKNIVKNKTNSKYKKWFEFAEKTKKPDNKEEDFLEYMDDEIFCQIVKRIHKKELTEDDSLYIENEKKVREEVERFERQIYEDGIKEGKEKTTKEFARAMKASGLPIEKISEITNLSKEEIDEL